MAAQAASRRARRNAGRPAPWPRVLACLLATAGTAHAQQEIGADFGDKTPAQGVPARRTVRLFDFDDERNPDPVPPAWERTTLWPDGRPREGFPKFNLARLDEEVAHSGRRSVRLPTQGGATALRLRAGELGVFADADYAIAAWVRTRGLEHARAFVSARLLDQQLRVIPGTEVRTEPVSSEGGWRLVQVHLRGGRPGAAWLQIDLELLQPRQFAPPVRDDPADKALEQHRIWREDVRGDAWFDDVAVMQIPRASIAAAAPANIVHAAEKPVLNVNVRDLGGEPLRGRIEVADVRGRVVDRTEIDIAGDGRTVSFSPRLPGYGWYSARLEVVGGPGASTGEGIPISRAGTRFVWLAPPVASSLVGDDASGGGRTSGRGGLRRREVDDIRDDRSRFGLIAEMTPDARLADLPPLVSRLGTRFIHLPAWHAGSIASQAAEDLAARRPTIESLLRTGQTVTLTLGGVPSELSRNTGAPADDALALAATPAAQWMPYLTPTLDVFGQRVLRYQLGATGEDHAFWKQDLAADVMTMETALATLVPGPVMGLAWPADRTLPPLDRPAQPPAPPTRGGQPPPPATDPAGHPTPEALKVLGAPADLWVQEGPLVDALTIWYPAAFPASETREVLRPLVKGDAAPAEATIVLDLPRAETFGGAATAAELMRRAVEVWALLDEPGVGTIRLALRQPWMWNQQQAEPQLLPGPELAVFSTLMERLSGRRIVGELAGTPGVKCYILAARNPALGTLERGALIAWNEGADPDRSVVDAAAMGGAVLIVDAFGNQRVIPVGVGSEGRAGGATPAPLVTVPLGETPVFIEGIDPYLALFAASFRLEPSFMPAVVREHEHWITLSNPWPLRITGKLQLKEDDQSGRRKGDGRSVMDEWRVSPTGIIDFDMGPGQTQVIPVTLSFQPGQLAGIKDFVIVARTMADRPYPPIRLRAPVEVGLPDLDMNPELQVTPSGDVIVIASVVNKGTRPRTVRLETAARGMPSQQLQISDLPPGQTVLRRFVFKEAAKALSGRRIVVSLSDHEEAERLNKAVEAP